MIELNHDGQASVDVTFRMPIECGGTTACVVGEFNEWSTTAHPMQPDADGFTATIPLDPGRTYRFRYLLDGEHWENDWAAHTYVPNEFGGDDSVVDLRDVDTVAKPSDSDSPSGPDQDEQPAPTKPRRARRSTSAAT
jgi:1,4-alpha-glucan branching enzyme